MVVEASLVVVDPPLAVDTSLVVAAVDPPSVGFPLAVDTSFVAGLPFVVVDTSFVAVDTSLVVN